MRLRPTYVSAERAEGLSAAGRRARGCQSEGQSSRNRYGGRQGGGGGGRRRWWQSPRSVGRRRVGADTRATTQRQNRGHESNFERGTAWHKISTNTHAKRCSPSCWMPEIGNSYSYLVMHLCVSLPFPLPISISQSDFVSSVAPVCVVRPALPFSPGPVPSS